MARVPFFLRWSVFRMALGGRTLTREWQVGDGREQGALDYVLRKARPGSLDAAIDAIDEYAYERSYLINVGDEKGAILDAVVERTRPKRVLELGAYVGYSALRIARKLPPGGRLTSVEYNAANAEIARRIVAHAGASDRVTFVVGSLGDGGHTLDTLEHAHGLTPASLDLVFIDHDKDAYLPDLQRILARGWLRNGSVAVADNIRVPGAPAYEAYMRAEEGKGWRTEAHETHVEYQSLIPDRVLVSERLA